MARIRLLINAIHAKTGGGVTHLTNILPFLAGDPRLETHLVIHASQRQRFGELDERIRVHEQAFREGFFPTMIWEQLALPRLARGLGADVTFSPANYGPLFAPRPVNMLRSTTAVVGRDWRPRRWVYWSALAGMTVLTTLFARRTIAVSDYARRALTFGLARVIGGRISVVHHGVDPAFSPPADGHERAPWLLAVGDIYVQKNYVTLIEALAIARARHPGLTLKIAGRDVGDEYMGEVRKAVTRHDLGDAVEILGHLDKQSLAALYRGCAMLVFPSTAETFGHPLAEAMASAAPIASSNRSAMPEILDDAAVWFDPGDARAMAGAINRILGDPALSRELSLRGLARVGRFSWAECARRTSDILVAAARRNGS